MSLLSKISNEVKTIKYIDFHQYLEDLLVSFMLPSHTVKRSIRSALENPFKPILIYKRAAFVHVNKDFSSMDVSEYEKKLSVPCRMLVLISDSELLVKDFFNGNTQRIKHENLYEYMNLFAPLIFGVNDHTDIDSTLDISELIGSLYNTLTLDEENVHLEQEIIDYILSLIYFSFQLSVIKDTNVKSFLEAILASNEKDHNSIVNNIFARAFGGVIVDSIYKNIPALGTFSGIKTKLPHITRSSFEHSSKILCSDLSALDSEVLGSLMYKLTKKDANPSIYGHQTTSTNVAKVLEPLFVSHYEDLISEHAGSSDELIKIKNNLLNLKFFDPTDGPGCFLSSSLSKVAELTNLIDKLTGTKDIELINISNFTGLLSNNLSLKLTRLTLWVTYIQYLETQHPISIKQFQEVYSTIQVVEQNQLTSDWNEVCSNNGKVLLIGSPIFKGAKKVSKDEKKIMEHVFDTNKLADTDYSACWLYKAAQYISNSNSKAALVLTNSVCQGTQVSFVWKKIYEKNCEIDFARRSFKWKNSSNFSTGVSVVIVGLVDKENQSAVKKLFVNDFVINTQCIGPYLINSTRTIVEKRSLPLSENLPKMQKGNMPYDNQHLLLSNEEKTEILSKNPEAAKFIKKIVGSDEFINSIERWCLWVSDQQLDEALKIGALAERIEKVKQFRLSKTDSGAKKLANRPHQFREFRSTDSQTLVIPSVSSEKRVYIPIGFIGPQTVVSNLAFAIYNCEPWIFGLVSSRMHMVWIRTVCGNLETRIRYSSQLGYNTFPFPKIDAERKKRIASLVFEIIKERENYCGQSLGEIYNDLPVKLQILHDHLDNEIESSYQSKPFTSDIERLEVLFDLYNQHQND
jgi:hypothetical protein